MAGFYVVILLAFVLIGWTAVRRTAPKRAAPMGPHAMFEVASTTRPRGGSNIEHDCERGREGLLPRSSRGYAAGFGPNVEPATTA